MASDSPLSPAVAGPHIAFGRTGKTSPGGDVAGGGDEIYKEEQTPPPHAVGVECLLDPSVPVAATEGGDVKITVTTAVAGDGPNVDSGCGLFVGIGAGVSSGSRGQSCSQSGVIESENGVLPLQPQDTNLAETTPVRETDDRREDLFSSAMRRLERIRERLAARLPAATVRQSVDVEERGLVRETGRLGEGRFHYIAYLNSSGSTGGIPLPQPDNEVLGLFDSRLHSGSWLNMGGIPVLHPVDVDEGSLVRAGIESAYGGSSMPQHGGRIICVPASIRSAFGGISVPQHGRRILGVPAVIGLSSPTGMGDTLVFQTGNVEGGRLLAGSHFGVGRADITPTNDDFRMYIMDAEPQTGNFPPPLETSGDDSHLAPSLERHFRSNCFVILFVTSEILGIVFEIIYQESRIMGYFFFWTVCITIAMYAARLLAMIEGGMANREQFAVYFRGFSFLLLELLQYWGINQGNYVTALKIILRVSGAVIGWWVVGVLQTYMDAFGIYLPLRRRDD